MKFDAALKSVLQKQLLGGVLSARLGLKVTRLLNVEIPEVRTLRLDILGEAEDGGLVHCEVQTRNDALMCVRMAEYAFAVFRQYGRMPRQVVLYLGASPLRMETRLDGPGWSYHCNITDARDLDSVELLHSPLLADNVFAVPARTDDQRALVFGREEGRIAGLEEGLEQGRHETALKMVRLMISKRFGRVPADLSRRLKASSAAELETLAMRIFEVASPSDLLPH